MIDPAQQQPPQAPPRAPGRSWAQPQALPSGRGDPQPGIAAVAVSPPPQRAHSPPQPIAANTNTMAGTPYSQAGHATALRTTRPAAGMPWVAAVSLHTRAARPASIPTASPLQPPPPRLLLLLLARPLLHILFVVRSFCLLLYPPPPPVNPSPDGCCSWLHPKSLPTPLVRSFSLPCRLLAPCCPAAATAAPCGIVVVSSRALLLLLLYAQEHVCHALQTVIAVQTTRRERKQQQVAGQKHRG